MPKSSHRGLGEEPALHGSYPRGWLTIFQHQGLLYLAAQVRGQLSTVPQAKVQTRDTCMAFGGNIGLGHQHRPQCHRTMDPDVAPAAAWALMSPWLQTAAQATQISTSPCGSTALRYPHVVQEDHGPRHGPLAAAGPACHDDLTSACSRLQFYLSPQSVNSSASLSLPSPQHTPPFPSLHCTCTIVAAPAAGACLSTFPPMWPGPPFAMESCGPSSGLEAWQQAPFTH